MFQYRMCYKTIALIKRQAPNSLRTMVSLKTSHIERTASEPRSNELLPVKLNSIRQINSQIRLLHLSLSNPAQFLPGQWLDTYIPGVSKPGGFTLTSSPSSASSSTPYFELAIQRSPQNPAAAWLWRPEPEILGQELRVRIGGSFVFPPNEGLGGKGGLDDVRRVVFVVGGVGVNPCMSMLSFLRERREFDGLDVRVAYSSRLDEAGIESILFLNRIQRVLEQGKGALHLYLTRKWSQDKLEINGAGTHIHTRRMDAEDLKELVGDTKSSLVYICGPPIMTDEFVTGLTSDGGIDPARVKTEKWW